MGTNYVNDLKAEAKRRACQSRAGLQSLDTAVLLALLSDVDPEGGEVTTVRTVHEIAVELALTEHQVQRSLIKLRDLGFIARQQQVRRAGESAFTTILPAAYSVLGVASPAGNEQFDPLPPELTAILCGQPWSVLDAVTKAWHAREPLPEQHLGELRGALFERLKRAFDARSAALMEEQEAAIAEALDLEALREAGFDQVETSQGVATVNVRAFEQACPEATSWVFVKDVLALMHSRNPGLVTLANLRDRIAEAAYARAALPFVRDKGWSDAVRLLARQMEIRWDKPRRIWPGWYSTVDQLIHRPAVSTC